MTSLCRSLSQKSTIILFLHPSIFLVLFFFINSVYLKAKIIFPASPGRERHEYAFVFPQLTQIVSAEPSRNPTIDPVKNPPDRQNMVEYCRSSGHLPSNIRIPKDVGRLVKMHLLEALNHKSLKKTTLEKKVCCRNPNFSTGLPSNSCDQCFPKV